MLAIATRNLSGKTHRTLEARPAQHRRSTESEIRPILEEAVRPDKRIGIGSALAAFGHSHGGLNLDITRDRGLPEPAVFE